MSLSACMEAQGIGGQVLDGLLALGAHRQRVTITPQYKATCSVDLDTALAKQCPNDPRWDYGVELQGGNVQKIAWLEVHPATSTEVKTVLNKLQWLKDWLNNAAAECNRLPKSFHWIATDAGVHIDSARRRRLNAAGLRMPRRHLQLPNDQARPSTS